MINLNHKGFALVETLVVSAFVVGIFTLVYTNYYPLIGEYEKREEYDSIESIYKTDLVKRMMMRNQLKSNNPYASLKDNKRYVYDNSRDHFCSYFTDTNSCSKLWNQLKIKSILATNYTVTNVKKEVKNMSQMSESMKEYVLYLPNYTNNKYYYKGRVIVEYEEEIDTESNPYQVLKYSTIGVDLYD